ncbi:MAG: hypothetical protein ACM3MG_03195 [Bacillota bacterium]
MKTSKKSAGLQNNRGQAVIEYVLLLIISVSLVLMLVYQIFKPMQNFVQGFMGDYMACLLETGELPAFGGTDASATKAADLGCSAKFNNITGNSSGASGAGSGSGSDSSSASAASKASSRGNDSGSGSSSSGGGYAGSSSRNGSRYLTSSRRGSSGVDGSSSAQGGKVVEIALDGGGSGGFFKGSNGGGYIGQGRKITSVGVTGLTDTEKKKLEKKAMGAKNAVVASGEFGTPPKKISVKKPEPKREIASEDEPLTIGNFIRYLFIAALVLALVIFIGGQALQMSKSGEN